MLSVNEGMSPRVGYKRCHRFWVAFTLNFEVCRTSTSIIQQHRKRPAVKITSKLFLSLYSVSPTRLAGHKSSDQVYQLCNPTGWDLVCVLPCHPTGKAPQYRLLHSSSSSKCIIRALCPPNLRSKYLSLSVQYQVESQIIFLMTSFL